MTHPAISKALEGATISGPLAFKNLAVFPLADPEPRESGYLTLDEAVATGRFRITEVSEGGSVAELRAVNETGEAVLLLEGEELVGAKQNRVLNLTILVPAGATLVVPVSCVEAGRWHHASAQFAPAPRTQFARGRASKTAQVSESMLLSGSRRSDQGEVWREIGAKATRMDARSATSAMAAIYERHSASVEDYVRALPLQDGQVGAVFAIGESIVGMDLLDSSQSFARVGAKLVRSYALDALEAGNDPIEPPGRDSAVRFVACVVAAEVREFPAIGEGTDLRLTGKRLAGAALACERGLIHLSAFRLENDGATQLWQSRMTRASNRQRRAGPHA